MEHKKNDLHCLQRNLFMKKRKNNTEWQDEGQTSQTDSEDRQESLPASQPPRGPTFGCRERMRRQWVRAELQRELQQLFIVCRGWEAEAQRYLTTISGAASTLAYHRRGCNRQRGTLLARLQSLPLCSDFSMWGFVVCKAWCLSKVIATAVTVTYNYRNNYDWQNNLW